MARKLDLYDARPTDRVFMTGEGGRYWWELQRHPFVELRAVQQVEWDLCFDLAGFELPLGTFLRPGRDSVVGYFIKKRPRLGVLYEVVLQGMIERGLIEVKK